jgi:hypothetical protein
LPGRNQEGKIGIVKEGTMKKGLMIVALVCLTDFPGCKNILGPDAAKIVIDGPISINMTTYGSPQFQGWVKNTGGKTAYNCLVKFIVYSDAAKKNIIDSASGFPANLGDIAVGARAYFEAVCFKLTDVSQIVAYDTEIAFLEK